MAVTYIHRVHPRSHSIKIKVEANGQVVVVTPRRVNPADIEAFVIQQATWIEQAKRKLALRTPVQSADHLTIFGKEYHKTVRYSSDQTVGVHVLGDTVIINPLTPRPTAAAVEKSVDQFLKNMAEKYIVPRTHQLAQTMDITFSHITLRQQKTRWGSCSRQGTLNFNWRLVHFTPAIIDYVIIHELAHRRHMNHSDRFWQLVKTYDPEYTQHRRWLKRYGTMF